MSGAINLHLGKGFGAWLAEVDATIVITTYQAGKIVLIDHDGANANVLIRDLFAPMGLAIEGAKMAIALRDRVIELADAPELPQAGSDHFYASKMTYATGDIRAHEIAFGRDGLWIVNTRFSCLALASKDAPFEARWRPKFISALAPEDRCHLSGLAMENGAPAYVTAHAATDSPGGWREKKAGGGVIIDVATGEPLVGGFMMPHSPRLANGALWLLDSGQGVLAKVDRKSGARTAVASVPGFARGLAFLGRHALVGLSKIRESNIFGGMPIAARRAELFSGVAVVDIESGQVIGALRFTSGCDEVFDIGILPGQHRVGLETEPGEH